MQRLPSRKTVLTLALSASLFSSCRDPEPEDHTDVSLAAIDHDRAALTLDENLRQNLVAAAEALAFAQDSWLVPEQSESADCAVEGDVEAEPLPCEQPEELDIVVGANDLASFLLEEVFVEENVVATTEHSVTYRLPIDLICGGPTSSPEPGPSPDSSGPVEVPVDDSPSCAEIFGQVPIELFVTSPQEGDLDVAVRVGRPPVEVVQIQVYHDRIGAELQLGALRQALQLYFEAAGEPADELPEIMQGALALTLLHIQDRQFTLRYSVTQDLHFAMASEGVDLQIAAADPAVEVDLDGASQRVEARVSLGAVTLTLPLEQLDSAEEPVAVTCDEYGNCVEEPPAEPEPELVGDVTLRMEHMAFAVRLSEADDVLAINGLAFAGEALFNGDPLVSAELGAVAGGLIDLLIAEGSDGVEISVSPSLSLALHLGLAAIADQEPDIPAWAMNEDFQIRLEGNAPRLRLLTHTDVQAPTPVEPGGDPTPEPEPETEPLPEPVVEVLSGSLHIEASSVADPIQVSAGQCLLSSEPEDDDAHPLMSLAAGACE